MSRGTSLSPGHSLSSHFVSNWHQTAGINQQIHRNYHISISGVKYLTMHTIFCIKNTQHVRQGVCCVSEKCNTLHYTRQSNDLGKQKAISAVYSRLTDELTTTIPKTTMYSHWPLDGYSYIHVHSNRWIHRIKFLQDMLMIMINSWVQKKANHCSVGLCKLLVQVIENISTSQESKKQPLGSA